MRGESLGLSDDHFSTLRLILFEPLQKLGCNLAVFGSRARGDFQQFSDLDVLISGNVSPHVLSEIREALEESHLPIRVDIVTEQDLADSYRPQVERERIPAPSFIISADS